MNASDLPDETLFEGVLKCRTPAERAAYLDQACAGQPELRRNLEALLQAHDQSGEFLEPTVAAARPTIKLDLPPEETSGTMIGRYKLLQKIGEGGMGVVYMAEQTEPVVRRVALKIIKLGMDTKAVVARFEAERQALALMDHPNIAKILDAGVTGPSFLGSSGRESAPSSPEESQSRLTSAATIGVGRPYFVMELVHGVPITEYCDKNKLSTQQRLELFIPVCQAIQHAHQKGIIHRDIKPSNVMVTLHDGVPVPKVIDFGVAKATNQRLTEKTLFTHYAQMIGTPAYMSPEQAEMSGLDIDTRTDVYSLGVLLYELLTGSTPFNAKELLSKGYAEMQRIIGQEEPPKPSTRMSTLRDEERTVVATNHSMAASALSKALQGDLDWIVMKCLEKDRTRRYETSNGLAADLRRHLSNELITARPPTTGYLVKKLIKRNQLAFAASAAVAAALVVGIAVSTWQALRARRSEREQERMRLRAEAGEQKAVAAQVNEAAQRLRAEEAQTNEKAQRLEAERHLYAVRMNLAQEAWEQDTLGRVGQLLRETAGFDDRGFEWTYWQRQTHLELQTLRGHYAGLNSVAFSPDGRRLVTSGDNGAAKVWATDSGRELLTLKSNDAEVTGAVFSPDGQRIATSSYDQTARVWDADSGRELLTLKGHRGGLQSIAFSPDGKRIATGSWDLTTKVWDGADGRELLTLKDNGALIWVAFSPNSLHLVTGNTTDGKAKVWEVATGRELLTLRGHTAGIASVAYSSDGRRIVTGSGDQTAKVWEADTGRELLSLKGHKAASRAAFSPDGQRIATCSDDQTVKVWEASSGRELQTFKGHTWNVMSLSFSPDGQRLATGSYDQTVRIWEVARGREQLSLEGHNRRIRAVACSPDGQRIATCSDDETVKLWEASSGLELFTLKGHRRGVTAVAFSGDSELLATGSADETAKVWESASGRERFTLKGHIGEVRAVAFAPDGRRVATGSEDRTVKVWEVASGQELLTLTGHGGTVLSTAFSPDGSRLLTGSADRTARVWDAATGRQLLALNRHGSIVRSAGFSRDGERIVTASDDWTVRVWETTSGRELHVLRGHNGGVTSAVFSPDGRRLVTGSWDKTAKLWDAAGGLDLLTLRGHSGAVRSVAFSGDGRRVITGSDDRIARVWEAATASQVSLWEQEEKAAEERLAALRREQSLAAERERQLRAQDPGVIRQWLVLAPIRFSGGWVGSGSKVLDQEQIASEGRLRPRAGDRVLLGSGERVWEAVELPDYRLNFPALRGETTEYAVAYAVCYIRSEVERGGLVLKVGSDDQSKVYLNGKEVYRHDAPRMWIADQDVVEGIRLNAGVNIVVFKVVNENAGWEGSLRFTDPAGQPLRGIVVTLDPEGKSRP